MNGLVKKIRLHMEKIRRLFEEKYKKDRGLVGGQEMLCNPSSPCSNPAQVKWAQEISVLVEF